MTLLSPNYFWLGLGGCWRPTSWPGWASNLYHLYTLLVFFEIISFMISGITNIATLEEIEMDRTFFDTLPVMLSFATVSIKIHCSIHFRDVIIDIEQRLAKKLLKLDDHQERMVYQHYRRITRNLTQYYTGLFFVVLIFFLLVRISMMDPPRILPWQGWFPYNYSSPGAYTITVTYQFLAICYSAMTNSAFDPLLPCILYYVCAHINILKLRFNTLLKKLKDFDINNNDKLANKLQMEQKLISEWVDYHIEILSWADLINTTFSKVVFVQYSSSSFILCAIAYVTSHSSFGSVDFIGNLIFLIAMYFQIYVQCVAADRMTIEFADVAVEVGTAKWFSLSCNVQKYMVIILAKSMRPVVFTCGFFLSLSLESFMKESHGIRQSFGCVFMLCNITYLMSHDTVESMAFSGNLCYFLAMNIQILFQCLNVYQMTVEVSIII